MAAIDLSFDASHCDVGQSATVFFADGDGVTRSTEAVFIPAGSNGTIRVTASGADTDADFSVRVNRAGSSPASAWFDTLAVSKAFASGTTSVEGQLCTTSVSAFAWIASLLFLTILIVIAVLLIAALYRMLRGGGKGKGSKPIGTFPNTSVFPSA